MKLHLIEGFLYVMGIPRMDQGHLLARQESVSYYTDEDPGFRRKEDKFSGERVVIRVRKTKPSADHLGKFCITCSVDPFELL